VDDSAISLSISDPARDGQANEAVIAFLASILDVKKYNLQIVKGHKSHQKLVQVDNCKELGLDDVDQVIKLLK